jgi:hypothetical protein
VRLSALPHPSKVGIYFTTRALRAARTRWAV